MITRSDKEIVAGLQRAVEGCHGCADVRAIADYLLTVAEEPESGVDVGKLIQAEAHEMAHTISLFQGWLTGDKNTLFDPIKETSP